MTGVERGRGRGRGNLGTREGERASRTPKFPLPLPLPLSTLATQASNKIARFFFMGDRRRNMFAIQLFLQQSRKKVARLFCSIIKKRLTDCAHSAAWRKFTSLPVIFRSPY